MGFQPYAISQSSNMSTSNEPQIKRHVSVFWWFIHAEVFTDFHQYDSLAIEMNGTDTLPNVEIYVD